MKLVFKCLNIYKGTYIPDTIGNYWVPFEKGYTCEFSIRKYLKFTKKVG